MLLNTVVNNTGTVEASGLSGHGGEIVLNGGDSGVVKQSGQLLADSHAGPGGKITVEGQNIHLAANSRTSATGKTGGGEVYVGGGWQGKDSRIGNASKVVMDRSATVDVSATDAGSGGTAVLWSDDYTNFRGTILAKGGALAGDGGRVETSSHKNLQAFGDVDTSASAGHGGNWLLDPLDVTIVSGDTNTSVTESGKGSGATLDTDTDHIFSPSASGARVSAQKIADQLNAGTDVTVDTHGDGAQQGNITLADNVKIQKTKDNTVSLTLKADKDIVFGNRGNIVATAGKLNLNLLTGGGGQGGNVAFGAHPDISLNGGDLLVGPANASGGNASMSFMNAGSINAGNITLNTGGGITGKFYSLNATENLTVTGPLSVDAGYNLTSNIKAGHLLNITADSGDISFTATKVSGEETNGKIIIEGNDGVNIRANNGHLVMNAVDKSKNTITVSSSNGDVNLTVATGNITAERGNLLLSGNSSSGIGISLNNATAISAKNDITINASHGGVSISGAGNASAQLVNITSTSGNISIYGNATGTSLNGVLFRNAILGAEKGIINITGVGNHDSDYGDFGNGISLQGNTSFISMKNTLNGSFTGPIRLTGGGISFYNNARVQFSGDTILNATSTGDDGVLFAPIYNPDMVIGFSNGTAVINAEAQGIGRVNNTYGGALTVRTGLGHSAVVELHVSNATLNINGEGKAVNGFSSYADDDSSSDASHGGGFKITGQGDVNIHGVSESGNGVDFRLLDNTGLTGNFTVNGESKSGTGVIIPEYDNVNIHNATITGTSQTWTGIQINAGDKYSHKVNLNGNTLTGTSGTGTGISVGGNNVTITNGTLNGTSGGSGAGVELTGGTNYTVDGSTVQGSSQAGSGVSVGGNLSVSNATMNGTAASGSGVNIGGNLTSSNTSINGTASGNGSGVSLNGNVTGDETEKNVITGHSAQGDGVLVSGNSTATNVTLNGNTIDGNGIKVTGNLTANNVAANGNASGNGNGVNLAGNVSGSQWHGDAANGTGVNVTGDSTLTNVSLNGTTENGTGINVPGNLTSEGATTVTGNATGNGTGAAVSGTLNGDIDGSSASGTGAAVNGTINGTVNGTTTSGTGAVVSDGANILQSSQVSGQSGTGTGSVTEGNVTNQGSISGQSDKGTGTALGGNLSGNGLVTGTTNGPGDGVNLSGHVTGGVVTGHADNGTGVNISGNSSLTNVSVNGSTVHGTGVTLGGNLTFTDDISGVSASATGSGTALKISDGVVDAKGYRDAGRTLVINATSENGTAVSTTGNSSLITVELRGTANGNGSAAVVNGTLSTDKTLTAVSKGDKGVGLQLSGGHLQSTAADNTPVKVTVSATGNGTAVAVTEPESGQSGSGLSGIDLNASADKGTVMDIDGDLTTDRDISVSTENGVALSLNGGSLQGAESEHPVTVTVQATGDGTAVTVKPTDKGKPGSSLANMTLHTTSAQGDALNVGGELNTKKVVVEAGTTGTGTALNVSGGEIHSRGETDIVATSDSGHAAVINNGKLTGDSAGALTVKAATKTDSPALDIRGTSDISNSVVSGKNSGNGSAVSVAGVVTSSGGGEIKGQTVNGTAVEIKDGTSVTSSQEGGLLITATASGEKGTGVALSNATLTGSRINADATQGNAVTIADGSITGGNIAGHAHGGVGLNISNAVLSKVVASGTTQTGTGTVINGTLTSDEASQITGTATQDGGNGVNVSGSVTGGKVEGHATSGDAVMVVDGSSVADAEVKGDAGSGTGVSVAGKATLTNASLSGTTQTGAGTVISGTLTSDSTSTITGTATQDGGDGVSLKGQVTGGTVSGHATSGDAVTVADGSSVTDAEVTGDAVSGTGLNVAGKATLTNASLSGTTQTGKGSVIAGSLTADNNSVVSGKATQDGGDGVSVSGNITGGKVEGHATSGNAVNITGAVNHGVIFGEATQGTGVVVNTGSQVTDSAINGNTTEGTGAHWHAGVKHNHVTITGNATSGTGVQIDADTTLKNATVSGSTENGKGVNIAGALVNTGSTTLTGYSSGPGAGVDVAGNISGGSITGNATGTGAGVTVSGQDVKVSDVVVKGNTVNGTGMSVTGNLTGSDSATVTGLATGSGMGVDIGGKLTGTISGSSSSGTGIRVTDGADIVQGSHADGNSESGTGAVIQGSVTNQGSISGQSGSGGGTLIVGTVAGKGDITGTSKGAGEGVILAGNVTGGGIIGQSDGGAGLSISDDSTLTDVTASGFTVTGTGVHVKGNLVNKGGTTVTGAASGNGTGMLLSGSVAGGVINGHSTDGVGVSTDRNVTLTDVAVNGTSVSHSGVQVSSDVTNTGSTVITGSSESGAGVSLNGTVSGGALKGHSVSGPGLHVTGDSQVNSVEVSSSSEQGSEVQMDGNLSSADSSLNGQALQDTVTTDILRQAAYQQQGVISHTARQKHPAMASGYKEQDKPLSVEICADGQCRKLDAGMLARPVRQ
ncbi:TPA: hypothetical protein ACF99E_005082 [Salmonella enterica subsp. enterica serovar Newport]